MNIKGHFPSQCNVTSAMPLLPFIMVPVKCPNWRNYAVFDIVNKSGGTTEIILLNCMFSLLLSHHEIPWYLWVVLLQFALQRSGLIFTSLNSLTIKFPTALPVTDKLLFDLISIKSTNYWLFAGFKFSNSQVNRFVCSEAISKLEIDHR